jgi:hypothetical protein
MSTLNRYSLRRYAAFSNEVKTIPMRLSLIRPFAIAAVATTALAACANQSSMLPSSPSAIAPTTAQAPATAQDDASVDDASAQDAARPQDAASRGSADVSLHALKTCATSPPQYEWIFKGACQIFSVTSLGGRFRLGEYQGITVKGFIGRNTAKGTVQIALANANDKNGDIKTYEGKSFPPYKANGITYFYASATNQSTQVVKPIMAKGEPVLQYTMTNANGFGDANRCGAALLTFTKGRKPAWTAFPGSGKVKGKTVTIKQYAVPPGIDLVPKTPLYFATNCYKK